MAGAKAPAIFLDRVCGRDESRCSFNGVGIVGSIMATGEDLRRIALALAGTKEAPHFDRAAFKVARTYVTLASDALSANFKFRPEEQEFACLMAPEAFRPVPNAWGQQGWTNARLVELTQEQLRHALETAWRHAVSKKPARS
jgi:hypothetical protein